MVVFLGQCLSSNFRNYVCGKQLDGEKMKFGLIIVWSDFFIFEFRKSHLINYFSCAYKQLCALWLGSWFCCVIRAGMFSFLLGCSGGNEEWEWWVLNPSICILMHSCFLGFECVLNSPAPRKRQFWALLYDEM